MRHSNGSSSDLGPFVYLGLTIGAATSYRLARWRAADGPPGALRAGLYTLENDVRALVRTIIEVIVVIAVIRLIWIRP